MIYAFLVLFPAVLGLLWLMRRDQLKAGKQEAQTERQENIIEDMYIAKTVRDALRKSHNNDAARELRDKYTRGGQ